MKKIKKIAVVFLVFVMLAEPIEQLGPCIFFNSIKPVTVNASSEEFSIWDGSTKTKADLDNNAYVIDTAAKLAWFASEVNSKADFSGKTVIITGKFDLGNQSWTPIGSGQIFDGKIIIRDCNIKNMNTAGLNSGLFGNLAVSDFEVDNLQFSDSSAAQKSGSWSSCNIGLLAGWLTLPQNANVVIKNSSFSGSLKATHIFSQGPIGSVFGGLEINGESNVTFENITIETNCNSSNHLGGVVGVVNDTNNTSNIIMSNVCINSTLRASNSYGYNSTRAGGVIGQLNGGNVKISQCSVLGSISSSGYEGWLGGFIGQAVYNILQIENSYVGAALNSSFTGSYGGDFGGGFLGSSSCGNYKESYIKNCYLSGACTSCVSFVSHNSSLTDIIPLIHCYYDKTVTEITADHMVYCGSHGFQHKFMSGPFNECADYTTEQMKEKTNYKDWDFTSIWFKKKNEYPVLRTQTTIPSIVETDYVKDGITYSYDDDSDSVYVKDCELSIRGDMHILSSVDDISVTKIGKDAFRDCSLIEKIYVPENVLFIEDGAFYGCDNLSELHLPYQLQSIKGGALETSDSIAIYSYAYSYAKEYADNLDIDFFYEDDARTIYIEAKSGPYTIKRNVKVSILGIEMDKQVGPFSTNSFKGLYGSNFYIVVSADGYNNGHADVSFSESDDNVKTVTVEMERSDGKEFGYMGNFIQCSGSSSVYLDETEDIGVCAYADDYNSLKDLVQSLECTFIDESISKIEDIKFVMPTSVTIYETDGGKYETWCANGLIKIKGIKTGKTKVTLKGKDCDTVDCSITVENDTDDQSTKGPAFTLCNSAGGQLDNESAVFYPKNWSLKSALIPFDVTREDKTDGSYQIKVSIGMENLKVDDETWSKFKKDIEDAKDRIDLYKEADFDRMKGLYKLKELKIVEVDQFNVLPKITVAGYIDNTYDKNGKLVSGKNCLAVSASWKGSISWQFVTPIGPFYLDLSGNAKVSGNAELSYNDVLEMVSYAMGENTSQKKITITPSISLEGGYGIHKVAAIGAKGTLSLPITIKPPTAEGEHVTSTGEFGAEASIHIYALFLLDTEFKLAKLDPPFRIWPKENKANGQKADSLIEALKTSSEVSEIDTSFSDYTSSWYPNREDRPKLKPAGKDKSIHTSTILQNGILTTSLPQQAVIDGKQVMVFQAYDDSRTTINGSVLKYSVCQSGIWSEPKPVWDNGCADTFADMAVVNGQLVLAWQKEKCEINGNLSINSDSVIKDITKNSEICYAVFDSDKNEFMNPQYITDNDYYDMMPRICQDSEDIIISWVRNDEADLMQQEGKNVIYTAALEEGGFSEEAILTEAPGTVDNYVLFKNSNGIQTVFSGESNDIIALFGTDGSVLGNQKGLISFSKDQLIGNLYYENGVISFISNGVLYKYDLSEKKLKSVSAGESSFNSTAVYCTNGDKNGYVWSTYDEETGVGSIVASIAVDGGYSEPVVIYKEEGKKWDYLSPSIDRNGNWQMIANAADMNTGLNALAYIEESEKTEIQLSAASVNKLDIKNGDTAVDYIITNTGDTTINLIKIKISLEDGTEITKEEKVSILPGETTAGTSYVDLSDIKTTQKVSLGIYADGQLDIENCIVEDFVKTADISVSGVYEEKGDKAVVKASLKNKGDFSTDAALHLYNDETMTTELSSAEIKSIPAGGSITQVIEIDKKDIIYNKNNAAYLTLKADVENGDYNEDDNVDYVILYYEPVQNISMSIEGDGSHSLSKGNSIQLHVTVTPENATNKEILWTSSDPNIAVVDSNGVVTGIAAGTVTITAVSKDAGNVSASCVISIMENNQEQQPTEPESPETPTVPVQPGTPINPAEPSTPVEPVNPGTPVIPSNPNIPANPETPTEPASPETPTVPTNPKDDNLVIKLLYYIVTFDMNGGTKLSRKTMTLLNDDSLGILPKTERKNYIFKGWYTQKSGGEKVNGSTVLNAATTLYAQWESAKPPKVKALSLKAKKNGQLKVSFKKVTAAKGYEIAYSQKKKFLTSSTKKAAAASVEKTLKKLKAGQRYYVKVRAYRIDSTGRKVYGPYSKTKSIKVK